MLVRYRKYGLLTWVRPKRFSVPILPAADRKFTRWLAARQSTRACGSPEMQGRKSFYRYRLQSFAPAKAPAAYFLHLTNNQPADANSAGATVKEK